MVSFCDKVIAEIMSAPSDDELKATINKSLIAYKANRGSDEVMYTINMIVSLQAAACTKNISDKSLSNLRMAVEIFTEYHMNHDRPF